MKIQKKNDRITSGLSHKAMGKKEKQGKRIRWPVWE
jgi:hypothetical protein